MNLFAINERYIMDIDDEDDDSRISQTDIPEADWYTAGDFPHTTEDNNYKYKFVVRISYSYNQIFHIREYFKNFIEYFDTFRLFGNDYAYGDVYITEVNNKVPPTRLEQPYPEEFDIGEYLVSSGRTAVFHFNIYFNKLRNFSSYEQMLGLFYRINKSYYTYISPLGENQWSQNVHFEILKRDNDSEDGWKTITYEFTPLYMPNSDLQWLYKEFFDRDDWNNDDVTTDKIVLRSMNLEAIMNKASVIAEKKYGIKLTPIACFRNEKENKYDWSWMSFDFSPIDSSVKKMDVYDIEEIIMNSVFKFFPQIYHHVGRVAVVLRSTVTTTEEFETVKNNFGRNKKNKQHNHTLDCGNHTLEYQSQGGIIMVDGKKRDFRNVRRVWFSTDDQMAIIICNKNGHLSSDDENIYFADESYYNVPGTNSFVHKRIANGIVWGERAADVEDDE